MFSTQSNMINIIINFFFEYHNERFYVLLGIFEAPCEPLLQVKIVIIH